MKKVLAFIIALLILMLTACGQGSQPQQDISADVQQEQEVSTSEDEVYVKEGTMEDGTTYILYGKGGPEGPVGPVRRAEYMHPDGSYTEEVYSEDGTLASMLYKGSDGTVNELTCYANGSIARSITTYPDGSSEEIRYADNATIDPEAGYIGCGTITYQAQTSADGQVNVIVENVEILEDGTWWETWELENGGYTKTLYNKERIPVRSITEDPVNGCVVETEYYESGATKKDVWTYTNSTRYMCNEFYENGLDKASSTIYEDGTEIDTQCNEEGYYTYYRRKDQYGEREYFAGENNELVKCIEEGTVYEGDAITDNQRNIFNQLQDMAAQVAYNKLNGI